ncbi:hypothetical protein A3H26_01785 [candidate division WWE3 bacterium RIFCSPLOWO2_12_FULL_36_10]|uniref:Uncharacterized protein n=1 Tax=candidate division WWE3 bacterium RIFCSPLOWO2_12_FULL_36_10 TaxID=1802630 RepID=A0A1F4VHH6_UNCKA|nr:MAG: hypothetical protein A3H26_01785 [candidate division WWE3 bacterium RIFCSPLOWO2_12_FULL_36_10]
MSLTVVHVSGDEDRWRGQINYLLRSSRIFSNIFCFDIEGMERFLAEVGLRPTIVLVNYFVEKLGDGAGFARKLKESGIPVIIIGADFVVGFNPRDECLTRVNLPSDLVPLIRRRLSL